MTHDTSQQIVIEKDVAVPMKDGVTLRANIFRPASGRFPVVLFFTPYGKDWALFKGQLLNFAEQGFAAMMVDVRGRFASDGAGDWQPYATDRDDGPQCVAWAAAQPFSTGDVVTSGPSYLGYTQWAAAVGKPAALRAIAPSNSIGNPYLSLVFCGGAKELGMLGWFSMMAPDVIARKMVDQPEQMAAAIADVMSDLSNLQRVTGAVPVGDEAAFRRTGLGGAIDSMFDRSQGAPPPPLAEILASQVFEDIDVPAFVTGHWFDCFARNSIDQFSGITRRAATEYARTASRLIMGPGTHGNNGPVVGERDFGAGAVRTPLGGMDPDQIGWYRSVLAGEAPSIPPVRIFVMGANVWRDEQEWPLARTNIVPWSLSSGGHANSSAGDGALYPGAPTGAALDMFRYDPANPVPTTGGNAMGQFDLPGPRDQRAVEVRNDVLIYSSAPLDEPIEVTGTPVVELWASTSAEDTDFVVRLVDVTPDGVAWNISEGVIRARFRHDPLTSGQGERLEPQRPYLYKIEMSPTSNLFKAGHRIRLQVTSSNFPRWDRNLNIRDQDDATLSDAVIAEQTILHDARFPSRILLPIIPISA